MDIGYARVRTGDQPLALQLDALEAAGCDKVFEETASGAKAERSVVNVCAGTALIVLRLDPGGSHRAGAGLRCLVPLRKAMPGRNLPR